jgi:hypothetical protein
LANQSQSYFFSCPFGDQRIMCIFTNSDLVLGY